jgi:cytochrome c peroxidase
MYQKFGALKDINLHSGTSKQDLGRFEVTGNEWDKHVFKVPSLRLAVKTPPYFHDGAVATIEEAIDVMIRYQLDRRVPVEERTAIIAFLKSLVGVLPEVKP